MPVPPIAVGKVNAVIVSFFVQDWLSIAEPNDKMIPPSGFSTRCGPTWIVNFSVAVSLSASVAVQVYVVSLINRVGAPLTRCAASLVTPSGQAGLML